MKVELMVSKDMPALNVSMMYGFPANAGRAAKKRRKR
jgi:hypothetical protein